MSNSDNEEICPYISTALNQKPGMAVKKFHEKNNFF